jgi:hypothetical protein
MTSDVTVVPIECVKDDVLMLMLMIGNHSDDRLLSNSQVSKSQEDVTKTQI